MYLIFWIKNRFQNGLESRKNFIGDKFVNFMLRKLFITVEKLIFLEIYNGDFFLSIWKEFFQIQGL